MADINVGVLAEQINSKADIDLRNIDTTKCDMVIEYQEPTEENGYTWYRLYATGWVEQGGIEMASGAIVTLPIAMADTKYTAQITTTWGTGNSAGTRGLCSYLKTTTSFYGQVDNNSGSWDWQVSGKVDPSVMLNHEILPSKAKNEEFEHRVIAFQKPTAANNYTWYRKYADGWVEQGGIAATTSENPVSVTYPVVMSDSNYTLNVSAQTPQSTSASTIHGCHYVAKETTRCAIACLAGNSGSWVAGNISWQVSGMAAE